MDAVMDLGDSWEMILDRQTGGLPLMRLAWLGGDPRVEMEIPPNLTEEQLVPVARILAMTYDRGYEAGSRDERAEIIASLSMKDLERDLRESD